MTAPRTLKTVLIANRGEIAVRIMRTVQEMGMQAVAIYSEADKLSPHVLLADRAYPLGGNASAETYLNQEKLLDIARMAQADAVHPGYGFLSENAGFAQACQDAGLCFIGPTPAVIQAMGDKIIAKQTMIQADVPVVPGWEGDPSDVSAARKAAQSIGYPVLVKAAAGGGGKGMRTVDTEAELPAALEAAAREAGNAFGDTRVFLEKYIQSPRHIEFQIFGDHHGQVVHLFERDCSIQRRHQKIIEESPSPFLTPALREKMGAAAVQAAQAIGYTNAGTVEFIVDPAGNYYFLEVNTRLQVEHPVTEAVTRQDLVRAQLLVAMGHPLPFTQQTLQQAGHAIECRLYAEDPENRYLPSTGTLAVYREPTGPGIRIDSGVLEGSSVSVYYDPMLAKIITWGDTREMAIARMRQALKHLPVLGVTTNLPLLQNILATSAFQHGDVQTDFLTRHADALVPDKEEESLSQTLLAMVGLIWHTRPNISPSGKTAQGINQDPWQTAGPWRGDI